MIIVRQFNIKFGNVTKVFKCFIVCNDWIDLIIFRYQKALLYNVEVGQIIVTYQEFEPLFIDIRALNKTRCFHPKKEKIYRQYSNQYNRMHLNTLKEYV